MLQCYEHQTLEINCYSCESLEERIDEGVKYMDKGKRVLDNIDNVELVYPVIGMTFESENGAYDFYNSYGRSVGFSVRKSTTRLNKDKEVISKLFTCSKQGEKAEKKLASSSMKSMTRCNCKALMEVKRMEKGLWKVVKFEEEHNHEVMTPTKTHLLRSQKKMCLEAENLINRLNNCGMVPSKIYNVFVNEAQGCDKVPFSEADVRRKVRELARRTYGNDANTVLEYFKRKQAENPNFFYSIQVDEGGQMCSCFWVDAKARIDYHNFGDVVVFDTTYKTNKYLMPFAPFTGVNHHKQSILFGCSLLVDECESSFEWLFSTWLEAMMDVSPKAIITDQDPAMSKAISIIFPNTRHRYCMWHILQKIPEKIPRKCYQIGPFDHEFSKCVYKSETPEIFENNWEAMIKKYDLEEVRWLSLMFSIREMWLPVYFKSNFFAGMSTTQRSESMNKYFKGFLDKNTPISKFVLQYEKALENRREKEKKQDFETINGVPVCKTPSLLEKHMSEIFTKKLFKIFQNEFWESQAFMFVLVKQEASITEYEIIPHNEDDSKYVIAFNVVEKFASCPCRRFEFEGIVCRHLFVILRIHCKKLPSHFIMKRWTCGARNEVVHNARGVEMHSEMNKSMLVRYNEICCLTNQLAMKGALNDHSYELAKKYVIKCLEELNDVNKEGDILTNKEIISTVLTDFEGNEKYHQNGQFEEFGDSCQILFLKDPNIVHAKGSGKRIQSGREQNWNKSNKPSRQCHNCYLYGHDSRICPHPKKDKKKVAL